MLVNSKNMFSLEERPHKRIKTEGSEKFSCHLLNLPNELIAHIFSFLELSDLTRVTNACQFLQKFRYEPAVFNQKTGNLISMLKLRGTIPVKSHVYTLNNMEIKINSISQIFFCENQLVFLYCGLMENGILCINLESEEAKNHPLIEEIKRNKLELNRLSTNQFRVIDRWGLSLANDFFQLEPEGVRSISATNVRYDGLPDLAFRINLRGYLTPMPMKGPADNPNKYGEINNCFNRQMMHLENYNSHFLCFSQSLRRDQYLDLERRQFTLVEEPQKYYSIYSLATGQEITLNSRQLFLGVIIRKAEQIAGQKVIKMTVTHPAESNCLLKGKFIYILDTVTVDKYQKIITPEKQSRVLKIGDVKRVVFLTEFDEERNKSVSFKLQIEPESWHSSNGFSFLPSQGEDLLFSNMGGDGRIYKIIKSSDSYKSVPMMNIMAKVKQKLLVVNDYYFVETSGRGITITVPGDSHFSLRHSYKESKTEKKYPRRISYPKRRRKGEDCERCARFNEGHLVLFESRKGKNQQPELKIEVVKY